MIAEAVAGCDVVACREPAAGTYLDASDRSHSLFRVCAGHFERLKCGEHPVIVAEPFDLAELAGEPALLLK